MKKFETSEDSRVWTEFAAAALQGLLIAGEVIGDYYADECASNASRYADALYAEYLKRDRG